jgi:hypothetical protein
MVKLQNTGAEIEGAEIETPAVETTPVEREPEPELTPESNGDGNNVRAEVRKYMSAVAAIGREHGTGKKALLNLARTIVEGSQEQVIKPDSAEAFYKKFRENSDKKATIAEGAVMGEANEGSLKAQISKLRAFIKFGNEWRDDASSIMDLAAEVHARLVADKDNKKLLKLSSTYSALVAVAREHMREERKGVPMTEEELQNLFLGAEPTPKTGADYVEAAIKSLKQAKKGREATDANPQSRDPVEDARLDDALEQLKEVLKDLDTARYEAMVKAEEKAAEKDAVAAAEEAADAAE